MLRPCHLILMLFLVWGQSAFAQSEQNWDERILYRIVDLQKEEVRLFWKSENDSLINSLGNLAANLKAANTELLFAINGGMFHADYSPVGLYIENGKQLKKLNRSKGKGNFNLKPNGVFLLFDDNTAKVVQTEGYMEDARIKFATQSGPMLLIDGQFHPAFNKGSSNYNIRNGVGVLPDGKLVFAMSKTLINFYEFALFFKSLGCKNALYLDGAISQAYYPEQDWIQTNRKFGVMIGVIPREN